jgi:hypothetical protein
LDERDYFAGRGRNFFFGTRHSTVLSTAGVWPRDKAVGREPNQSPLSSSEFKNAWSFISMLVHSVMLEA